MKLPIIVPYTDEASPAKPEIAAEGEEGGGERKKW